MMSKVPINCVYLQYLMEKKGWTSRSLAKEVGVTSATLSGWMRGAYQPHPRNLVKLARVLNVDKHSLLADDAKIAHSHLRKVVYKTVEEEIRAVEIPTLLQILRTLGLDIVVDNQTGPTEPVEQTEAEKQALELLNAPTIEENDPPNSE